MPGPDGPQACLVLWRRRDEDADHTCRVSMDRLVRLTELVLAGERSAADLRFAASHDVLTGLANRARFLDELRSAVAAPGLEAQVGVLYLDLDGFKPINDQHGHGVGDLVLQEVSRRLASVVRGGDLVARLGGDEFTILCPGVTDKAALAQLAERLVTAVAEPIDVGELHRGGQRHHRHRRGPTVGALDRGAGAGGRRRALPGQARGARQLAGGRGMTPRSSGRSSGRFSGRALGAGLVAGVVVLATIAAGCGSSAKPAPPATTEAATTATPLPGSTPEALAELQTAAVKTRAVQSLTATRPNNPPIAACPACTSYTEQYNSPDRFQITAVDPNGVKIVQVQIGGGVWLSVNGGPLKFQTGTSGSADQERQGLFGLIEGIDEAVSATTAGARFQWSDAAGAVWPVTVEDGYITTAQQPGDPASVVTYRDLNNTPPIVMPH